MLGRVQLPDRDDDVGGTERGGDGEEVVRAEVDVEVTQRWREAFPVLADRRL